MTTTHELESLILQACLLSLAAGGSISVGVAENCAGTSFVQLLATKTATNEIVDFQCISAEDPMLYCASGACLLKNATRGPAADPRSAVFRCTKA